MGKLEPHHADLLLKIYEMRREEKLRRAREWMMGNFYAETADEFNSVCAVGSEPNVFYRQMTTYWEMVAAIVNRGMIDEELFFETNAEMLIMWLRVKSVVMELRKIRRNPVMLHNVEVLAEKFEQWFAHRAPEALEEIRKGVAAGRKKWKETRS